MRRMTGAMLAIGFVLAGCTETPPPPLPARAKLCDVQLSLVTPWGGAWQMTMSNEGGFCWMDASRNGPPVVSAGIGERPAHGEARSELVSLNLVRIFYRPDPGFVGTDRFVVRMEPYTFTAPVIVTVVAPPAQAPLAASPANR